MSKIKIDQLPGKESVEQLIETSAKQIYGGGGGDVGSGGTGKFALSRSSGWAI
jgi:hypothetical protein